MSIQPTFESLDFIPLDHTSYQHEAEAIQLKAALEALGWEFWS